jgi:hypothetical protein
MTIGPFSSAKEHTMHEKTAETAVSRRALLGAAATGLAGLSTAAAAPAAPAKPGSMVRDRMWIFTVFAGGDNSSLESGGIRGGSRMTPAEGAFWLNVPNLLLIRSSNIPHLPGGEQWRAKTSFEQYATSFQPLDRVVWSVVGSGGKGGMEELGPVIQLAKKFPNIGGVYLDDFIIDVKKQPDGQVAGRPAIQPAELKSARERLKAVGRPMDVWITLYTHEICPPKRTKSPGFRACVPPVAEFLDMFDVLTLWTWNADELPALEENLAALEKIAPKRCRIALGMYIWDFPNRRPVPLDLMRHQCESGLKWLHEKRIHELIFLANTVLDVGLPSAEYARDFIAKVGGQEIR